MKLFSVTKIPVYLDAIRHHNEDRTSGEVKVVTLTCHVDPFDAKLATALDAAVRGTLFKLNHPDPQPHIRRCDFVLGLERQSLEVYAASDSPKPTITFDQTKISKIYTRTQKDKQGYTLVFDATFGPVGAGELAYVEVWRGSQRRVTFEPAEPNLEFADDEEATDDESETRPAPMFEMDAAGLPVEASTAPARPRGRLRKPNGGA